MLVTNRNVSRKLDYLLLLQIIVWSIWFCIIDFDWQMRLWDADFDWLKRLFDSIHNICSFAIITSTSSTWQQLWKWEGGGVNLKKTPLITSFKKLWKKTKKSWKGAGPTFKWCEHCWFRSILCTQWGTNPSCFFLNNDPWSLLGFPNSQPLSTLFTLKLLKMYSKFSKIVNKSSLWNNYQYCIMSCLCFKIFSLCLSSYVYRYFTKISYSGHP